MKILINGKITPIKKEETILYLKQKKYPNYDLVIYNGFPVEDLEINLSENDEIFFIQKGENISKKDLEATMMSRHTPKIAEKLKKASVGIAGLGGLGSNSAIALARIGVGNLVLVDFDSVEPSNLNRQQYYMSQLGIPKTKALKQTLMQINPYIQYHFVNKKINENNINAIFENCEYVIEAFDKAESKAMLIKELSQVDKVVVAASGVAGFGDNEGIVTKKINDKLYIVGDFEKEAKPGMGLMAPRVMIAASKQANLVVELILKD